MTLHLTIETCTLAGVSLAQLYGWAVCYAALQARSICVADQENQGGRLDGGLTYREEIEAALQQDTQRIGDVWRQKASHGQDAEAIRRALGLATVGSVHSCLGSIQTLLQCDRLTDAPTLAVQRARMLRSFRKRHEQLSEGTKERLRNLAEKHQRVVEDEDALANEAEQIESDGAGFGGGSPGIYVYTLPHYLHKPVVEAKDDDSKDRTYLKVGMSGVDAEARIKQQQTTALPEPILWLRLYRHPDGKADYRKVEGRLHRHLNAADHKPEPSSWGRQGVVLDQPRFR